MTTLLTLLDIVAPNSKELLYYTQGFAYGLAFWIIRCGRHAPCQIYLASSLVHFGLGMLHH